VQAGSLQPIGFFKESRGPVLHLNYASEKEMRLSFSPSSRKPLGQSSGVAIRPTFKVSKNKIYRTRPGAPFSQIYFVGRRSV
jgi:hypothetical protein